MWTKDRFLDQGGLCWGGGGLSRCERGGGGFGVGFVFVTVC